MNMEKKRFSEVVLENWKDTLMNVSQELENVSHSTESEFLTLGDSLNRFFSINSDNANQVNGVVDKINSGEKLNISGMTEQFDAAYLELEVLRKTFLRVTESFSELKKKVSRILEMKEFLSSISYSIKMLSILMKIKSSKLSGNLFSQEIKSIDALAKGISKNTKEITTYSSEVLAFIDESSVNISNSITDFDQTLSSNRKSLDSSFENLASDTDKTKETCSKIKFLSEQIFPEINNIVSGIQFHDIARQKLEHISEAIESLAHSVDFNSESEEIALRKLAIVLRLQIAHINNVKDEAQENSKRITSYLTEISRIAIEQGVNANIIQNIAGKNSSRMDTVSTQLQQLPEIFEIISSIKNELLKAVDVIDLNISKVAKQLKNIESFQTDLKLLTINSVVLASQMDKSGKVMSVIADNIKNLSNVVKTEIEIKEKLINDIVEISKRYKDELKTDLESKTSKVEQIFQSTTDVIKSIVKDDELVFELSNVTKSFEGEVSGICLKLKFEEIINQQLGNASYRLTQILEKIDAEYSPNDELIDSVRAELKLLEEQYTMQSERDVHESSVGGSIKGNESTGDDIELFEDASTEDSTIELYGEDKGPNDNIELFDTTSNIDLFLEEAPEADSQNRKPCIVENDGITISLEDEQEQSNRKRSESNKNDNREDLGDNVELF